MNVERRTSNVERRIATVDAHLAAELAPRVSHAGSGQRAGQVRRLNSVADRPKRIHVIWVICVFALILGEQTGLAADIPPKKDVAVRSLPLRTALHRDPSLGSPLNQLYKMYREANKIEELLGIYKSHLAQYPGDVNGQTVLLRLQMASGDPEALRSAKSVAAQFPQNAFLHFLLYEVLKTKRDPAALDALDKSIELEQQPNRVMARIDLLLPAAMLQDRRDLAEKHLAALGKMARTAQDRLVVARKMSKFKFYQPALSLLDKKDASPPSPETMVNIQLEAARAEVGLDRQQSAASRIDKLLGKLTADYWRRPEIVRRRLALVNSQSERQAIIEQARKRLAANPRSESAVIDLAQTMSGFEFRRDALKVLLDAGRKLPGSAEIEKRTLEMFDRLRDTRGREKYLTRRIKAQSKRKDLVLLHVKSQFLLGRAAEAAAELATLIKTLKSAEKATQLLEMARFLRRSTHLKDAAELFAQVVKLQPARLDVRRELAETYLAMGRRDKLRDLFTGRVSKQAALENLLDLVQFMIKEELFLEARQALSTRLKAQPENLDIRLRLAEVLRRLGTASAGTKLLAETRKLADTPARYRLWLESAVNFHEEFDGLDEFLENEQGKLNDEGGQLDAKGLERQMAFAEVASRGRWGSSAAELLQNQLAEDQPQEIRIKLRRQLIRLLDNDFSSTGLVEQLLKDMIEEEPDAADEGNARLALLYLRARRQDLAFELLPKIEVFKLTDPALLDGVLNLYRQQNSNPETILAIMDRLTVLNPTDRGNWERWLTALAATGNESRLRGEIRRLLAGVDKMELSDETKLLMESHLSDSFWRSLAEPLSAKGNASLADSLAMLDSVERLAQDDRQFLWVTWIRAFVLNRLNRVDARDEAIGELERTIARLNIADTADSDDESKSSALNIAFPDGLTLSLKHARQLLTSDRPRDRATRPNDPQGPMPGLKVKWTFDTKAAASIASVVALDARRTLICDRSGTALCVDAETGRLLWEQESVATDAAATAQVQQPQVTYTQSVRLSGSSLRSYMVPVMQQPTTAPVAVATALPVPVSDGRGRFYVAFADRIDCRSVKNGELLWRANVAAVAARPEFPPQGQAFVAMFPYGSELVTYHPASGNVARIDVETGKVIWERAFEGGSTSLLSWQNAGASLSGNRLLVYGPRTAIIDLTSGEAEWSFEPNRVRKFPVPLEEPSDEPDTDVAGSHAGHSHATPYPGPGSPSAYQLPYSSGYATPPPQAVSYLPGTASITPPPGVGVLPRGGVRLLPPAVVWASSVQSGTVRYAQLVGERLLLFDSSGLQVIRTDLPLAGKRMEATGTFFGMAGRVACILNPAGQLICLDTTNGTRKEFPLAEIGGQSGAWMQAAIDGPLAYLSGPKGIVCVNALSCRRVFFTPWPKSVAPDAKQPSATAITNQFSFQSGTFSAFGSGFGQVVAGSSQQRAGQIFPRGNQFGGSVATVSRVGKNVLYTTLSPTRLVALTGADPDGE